MQRGGGEGGVGHGDHRLRKLMAKVRLAAHGPTTSTDGWMTVRLAAHNSEKNRGQAREAQTIPQPAEAVATVKSSSSSKMNRQEMRRRWSNPEQRGWSDPDGILGGEPSRGVLRY
jgi:hypothetical protein